MAVHEVTVKVHLAWWVQPYLSMLVFFCILMNMEPDYEKLRKKLEKGVYIKNADGTKIPVPVQIDHD